MAAQSKALTGLWEEVQGDCDLARVRQALEAAPKDLLLDGWTPLHFLCENRSLANAVRAQGIALLVYAGVDCNAVDENGWSALHLLCKNRSSADEFGSDLSASVRELVAGKANVNLKTSDSTKTALHLLSENDACSVTAFETLLGARADVNAVDENGNTPLHYASENSAVGAAILSLLLSAKANPNVQNQFQATPFHYLCQNSAVTANAIKAMLKHSADPNIANNIGNTPLHYLCENYSVSVDMLREIITSKKANLTTTNSLGKTVFDCLPSRKQDCISYLQKFTAPTLVQTKMNQAVEVGGEDPSELPDSLQKALMVWNASLPPFDITFYHAVCCEPAFTASYEDVQETSMKLSESPFDSQLFGLWEKSLKQWRACILLAFAALIPPQTWDQYAAKYNRAVPADLNKVATKIGEVWDQFPDQSQRRNRFESLAAVLKTP